MILELPNYVDFETIDIIKNNINDYKIGKTSIHSSYNREGVTFNISKINELKHLDEIIYKLCANITQNVIIPNYKPVYAIGDSGYEYHCYEPKQICKPHADGEFTVNSSLLRVASVVFHLNTVHEGGELVFPNQNESIKTEKGKVVIFPPYSFYPHYTTPSEESREVIVTWFVYNGINIIKN